MNIQKYIVTIGVSLRDEPWLEKMAADMEYSRSQLWRVVYDGAPVIRRMRGRLEKLKKRKSAS
ncbi:MAG: hypothetical protein ACLQIB_06995 [Isosphaeraceae bacterium]